MSDNTNTNQELNADEKTALKERQKQAFSLVSDVYIAQSRLIEMREILNLHEAKLVKDFIDKHPDIDYINVPNKENLKQKDVDTYKDMMKSSYVPMPLGHKAEGLSLADKQLQEKVVDAGRNLRKIMQNPEDYREISEDYIDELKNTFHQVQEGFQKISKKIDIYNDPNPSKQLEKGMVDLDKMEADYSEGKSVFKKTSGWIEGKSYKVDKTGLVTSKNTVGLLIEGNESKYGSIQKIKEDEIAIYNIGNTDLFDPKAKQILLHTGDIYNTAVKADGTPLPKTEYPTGLRHAIGSSMLMDKDGFRNQESVVNIMVSTGDLSQFKTLMQATKKDNMPILAVVNANEKNSSYIDYASKACEFKEDKSPSEVLFANNYTRFLNNDDSMQILLTNTNGEMMEYKAAFDKVADNLYPNDSRAQEEFLQEMRTSFMTEAKDNGDKVISSALEAYELRSKGLATSHVTKDFRAVNDNNVVNKGYVGRMEERRQDALERKESQLQTQTDKQSQIEFDDTRPSLGMR